MLRRWIHSLCDLIYPQLCVVCGHSLLNGESVICTRCRWDMPLTEYWGCRENYVTELFAGRLPFEMGSAMIFYKSGSDRYRRMIHRMKYSSRRDIAYMMGEIYGLFLSQSELYRDIDLLVPVPLHWSKRMIRGYNQSEELCRGMASSMGVECNFRAVRRVRITKQQARRKSNQRWKNVSGAFRVTEADGLRGRHILLVDDVLTTGSTIEACAQAILSTVEVRLSISALAVARRSQQHRSRHLTGNSLLTDSREDDLI